MLEVSVITLTFNRPEALRRCLESLAAQSVGTDRFELVLVDVSDEPASGLVTAFKDRIDINHVRAANRGVAANRNTGARLANADILAFLDDDCVAEPGWLEQLLEAATDFPGALVGGCVGNSNPENAVSCAGQVITEAVDRCFNPPGQQPAFFPGMNFAVPRDRYLAVGGCDERFETLAAEDREFLDRWLQSGGTLVKAPRAVVFHEHRTDLGGFVRQCFNYGRGAWRYHRRRLSRGDWISSHSTRLHLGLLRYTRASMKRFRGGLRARVWPLLLLWEMSNAAGVVWQAARDTVRWPSGRSGRR